MSRSSPFDPRTLVWLPAAALAGYAGALFTWQLTHRARLAAYLLENQLPRSDRLALLGWLALGAVFMALLWAMIARSDHLRRWLPVSLLVIPLALLPLLSVPGIETSQPALVFSLIALVSLLVALIAQRWPRVAQPLPAGTLAATPVSSMRRPVWPGLMLVLAAAAAYAVFMSLLTLARHDTFRSYAFDLGIHSQSVYTLATRGLPLTTLYGPQPVNQFSDHFAPIFYLLTPFYWFGGGVRALLIVQSVALAAGAPAVYLLARRNLASHTLALALAVAYLLFPALHGINHFDFHEIALAAPLLLWSLYFLNAGRFRLFGLFLLLALLTKEEVALTGAAIGLYCLWQGETRRGLGVLAASLAYFLLVTGVFMPALGGGADIGRFEGMIPEGFGGFSGVAMTLATNPLFALRYALLDADKLLFLAQLLLPMLLLPLAAPGAAWIIAVPAFATLLLSSYRAQYLLETHYSAIAIPAIFFLAVLGAARLERRRFAGTTLAAALLVASLLMNWQYGWLGGKLYTGLPQPTARHVVAERLIAAIPPAASVSTLSVYVPHLAGRERIYLYPTVADADYILFDAALTADYFPLISRDPRGEAIERLLPYLTSGEYGAVQVEDGLLLLQRGHDPAANAAALAALGSVTYRAAALAGAPGLATQPDADAADGAARVSAAFEPGDEPLPVVFGPYATLIPGHYRIDFRIKLLEPPTVPEDLVATVDVFSFAAGGQVVQQNLTGATFSTLGQYQVFSLELTTDKLLDDVEFRVRHSGRGTLAVDIISVVYLNAVGQ